MVVFLTWPGALSAQTTNSLDYKPASPPEPLNWTTQQDHRNMMEQLGIVRLRPGPGQS
jgi:hypothetical protein